MVDESDQSEPVRKGVGNHAALKSVNWWRGENCEEVNMKESEVPKRASWSRISY